MHVQALNKDGSPTMQACSIELRREYLDRRSRMYCIALVVLGV